MGAREMGYPAGVNAQPMWAAPAEDSSNRLRSKGIVGEEKNEDLIQAPTSAKKTHRSSIMHTSMTRI